MATRSENAGDGPTRPWLKARRAYLSKYGTEMRRPKGDKQLNWNEVLSPLDRAKAEHERDNTPPCPRCSFPYQPGAAERYWEARWRDEKAENDRLRAALEVRAAMANPTESDADLPTAEDVRGILAVER